MEIIAKYVSACRTAESLACLPFRVAAKCSCLLRLVESLGRDDGEYRPDHDRYVRWQGVPDTNGADDRPTLHHRGVRATGSCGEPVRRIDCYALVSICAFPPCSSRQEFLFAAGVCSIVIREGHSDATPHRRTFFALVVASTAESTRCEVLDMRVRFSLLLVFSCIRGV